MKIDSISVFRGGSWILLTLGMTWGQTSKWYYVPYRSLKPYRAMGVELKVHETQSADHDELGRVTFPLKASVVLDSDMLAFLTGRVTPLWG